MVTLANLQGGSLAANVGPQLKGIGDFLVSQREKRETKTAQQAKQQTIDEQIDVLAGKFETPEEIKRQLNDVTPSTDPAAKQSRNQEALLRLNAIDPKIGKAVMDVISAGNVQERERLRLMSERRAKDAVFVGGQKDFASKQRAIGSLANAAAARGEPIEAFIELQNLSEPELDLELQRMKIAGQDLEQILKTRAPLTDVGQARQDLKAGLITEADFKTITSTPKKFQTDVGKLIGDRQLALEQFGEGSEQVAAINEAIASDQKGEEPKLSDVAGIRKEFTKLSGDFIQIRDGFKKLEQAALNPSAAGDLAMIFSFMKILDPASVVRESEFDTAQRATSLPGQLGAAAQRVVNGQRMLPEQRTDFLDTARRNFNAQAESQINLETNFRKQADLAEVDPERVVIDFLGDTRPGTPEAAAVAEPQIIKFDAQGNIIQ